MADGRLITNQEVVELIKAETGAAIAISTWRSYVARNQAPAPVERRAGSPFYSRKQVLAWIHHRPGIGARTDLTEHSSSRGGTTRTRRTEPAHIPESSAPNPTPDSQGPPSA